jgi:D-glycero-D-manno-heptose 1,7-bisphosphate phosphatase
LNKALFLDRDGVINIDKDYIYKKEDVEFIDGIFDLCNNAILNNFLIIVITNQSGIARGFYSEREYLQLMRWIKSVFKEKNSPIFKVMYCPYHKDGKGKYKKDSNLRKPNPGMIFRARDRFHIDLSNSILIGDQETDIESGISAGIINNYLLYNPKKKYSNLNYYKTYYDLRKITKDLFPFSSSQS